MCAQCSETGSLHELGSARRLTGIKVAAALNFCSSFRQFPFGYATRCKQPPQRETETMRWRCPTRGNGEPQPEHPSGWSSCRKTRYIVGRYPMHAIGVSVRCALCAPIDNQPCVRLYISSGGATTLMCSATARNQYINYAQSVQYSRPTKVVERPRSHDTNKIYWGEITSSALTSSELHISHDVPSCLGRGKPKASPVQ